MLYYIKLAKCIYKCQKLTECNNLYRVRMDMELSPPYYSTTVVRGDNSMSAPCR